MTFEFLSSSRRASHEPQLGELTKMPTNIGRTTDPLIFFYAPPENGQTSKASRTQLHTITLHSRSVVPGACEPSVRPSVNYITAHCSTCGSRDGRSRTNPVQSSCELSSRTHKTIYIFVLHILFTSTFKSKQAMEAPPPKVQV